MMKNHDVNRQRCQKVNTGKQNVISDAQFNLMIVNRKIIDMTSQILGKCSNAEESSTNCTHSRIQKYTNSIALAPARRASACATLLTTAGRVVSYNKRQSAWHKTISQLK